VALVVGRLCFSIAFFELAAFKRQHIGLNPQCTCMVDPIGHALIHCTSCGKRQAGSPDLCVFCGAPLTSHGGTDPVLGIFARGFAARQATTNPRKPIVVIGIWLWMGPVVVLTLTMASMSLSELFRTIGDQQWLAASGAALGLIFSSALVTITFTILVRTTEAYFRTTRAPLLKRFGQSTGRARRRSE
jgi:hypothetical protein